MNKSLYFSAALLLLSACGANARLTVEVPKEAEGQQLIVNYIPFMAESDAVHSDTITVTGPKTVIEVPESDNTLVYTVSLGDNTVTDIFIGPGEHADIKVESLNPFGYTMSGTPLLEGIQAYNRLTEPIQEEYMTARAANASAARLDSIYTLYLKTTSDFIASDPKAPAAAYALAGLRGEEFLKNYELVKPGLDKTPFAKYINSRFEDENRRAEAERRQAEMAKGDVEAPDFTLKNPSGQDVTLSDFRGRWVILDFWGSWCIWCIKGFPELKENYHRYAGKLQVIGVDCGDTPEKWREAIEKYELPWVNVYNPQSEDSIDRLYQVQGFPTKVIINPEGKIVDITTGEDPAFYERLAGFIK